MIKRTYSLPPVWRQIIGFFTVFASFFFAELLAFCLLSPPNSTGLLFGAVWSLLLTCALMLIPRKVARILYGIVYYLVALWGLAQAGYDQFFNKMMWVSTTRHAGEGAVYIADVFRQFPLIWWLGLVAVIGLGVFVILKFPATPTGLIRRIPFAAVGVAATIALSFLPELVFLQDSKWGDQSVYYQSSTYRATYNTMYDAKKVYNITGLYHLTFRDVWINELYPLTPAYKSATAKQTQEIDDYFAKRGEKTANSMTGVFAGKNVVLVLMESIDDWMVTSQDTPTIQRLMDEGIRFNNFYTPGYGSARTLNSEFCMNTGIYLPTTGSYVFDYVNNSFDQSIASQLGGLGYTSKVFHYNAATFYSRGVLIPALGYSEYVSYKDYAKDKSELYDECFMFNHPSLNPLFFREGQTLNTIITRSAHLGYTYREMIAHTALQKYPYYRGLYGSEEEDSARVKAKIVDDMFARLLQELESHGQLENTVIIGMTDHYTYGYKNIDELYAHSGVDQPLLLEKTPCFIWSAGGPTVQVNKTLQTADFLPTVLNLLGVDSPYHYLGQDAFDPDYKGYAIFPDGSWISDGVAYQDGNILMNVHMRQVTQAEIKAMAAISSEFRHISNLLLIADYYN